MQLIRLELNTDIDDMLFEISETIVNNIKEQATAYGDVLDKQGLFYIKSKKDLLGMIEDLLGEHGHLDKEKYSDKLSKHFLGEQKAKSIKINGKPIKYYPLNTSFYYTSEEAAIIDEFDDLSAEFTE